MRELTDFEEKVLEMLETGAQTNITIADELGVDEEYILDIVSNLVENGYITIYTVH